MQSYNNLFSKANKTVKIFVFVWKISHKRWNGSVRVDQWIKEQRESLSFAKRGSNNHVRLCVLPSTKNPRQVCNKYFMFQGVNLAFYAVGGENKGLCLSERVLFDPEKC